MREATFGPKTSRGEARPWSPAPGLRAISGGNFSGRTQLLRTLTATGEPSRRGGYVPLEVYNVLSGLAPTVGSEILLHTGADLKGHLVAPLIELLGLNSLWGQHPFGALSGGEQAALAVVCALAVGPDILALDCALEQLDTKRRYDLLRWIGAYAADRTTLVADNRLREIAGLLDALPEPEARSMPTDSMLPIHPIDASRYVGEAIENPCVLRLEGVTFGYRSGSPVIHELSATLEPGNIYFLQGANGAGKTTIAKLLAGLLRPDSGRFLLNERRIIPWRHPGRSVAYHFQNPDVQLFTTSVGAEVQAGQARGADAAQMLLETFGIADLVNLHPGDLPFTLRKRVALAATLAMSSPWLILDEPTLGQDDTSTEHLAQILEQIRATGRGILIITHSLDFQDRLDGIAVHLRNGRLTPGGRNGRFMPSHQEANGR